MRCVDPAVETTANVVDDRMCIADAKPGVELLNFVGLAIAIRIAQPEDVRCLRNDHAVLVESEAGHEFEAFVENLLLIHPPVLVSVSEDRDSIDGRALLGRRTNAEAGILP